MTTDTTRLAEIGEEAVSLQGVAKRVRADCDAGNAIDPAELDELEAAVESLMQRAERLAETTGCRDAC